MTRNWKPGQKLIIHIYIYFVLFDQKAQILHPTIFPCVCVCVCVFGGDCVKIQNFINLYSLSLVIIGRTTIVITTNLSSYVQGNKKRHE